MCDCMICERIDWIKKNENPYFVRELGQELLDDRFLPDEAELEDLKRWLNAALDKLL